MPDIYIIPKAYTSDAVAMRASCEVHWTAVGVGHVAPFDASWSFSATVLQIDQALEAAAVAAVTARGFVVVPQDLRTIMGGAKRL
jgi:hypothetical protein